MDSVGCSTGHSGLQGETLNHECIMFVSPKKTFKKLGNRLQYLQIL